MQDVFLRLSSGTSWSGKTTLAQIIANKLETPFYTLSAVTSGVKDVREVIERAKSNRFFSQSSPILFIDEIHRFSKSQQDSLLGAVENGTVTLIGATTENPSFEVIRPSPLPLPALCAQIFGKGRFARTSATCHHHRHHTGKNGKSNSKKRQPCCASPAETPVNCSI